ncbi:Short-chain-enoyl-CoA hydratase [bioreactor metagenome]|uniref:Short-chain-enoyl-CoA hydratase n=1 Tax=bioreactor metagenome TaxID=1076179 RepID=A0A645AR70_9ZZZZ|nr:enoyl-CoA hydratase-related protein [Anaerotignum propionicum]MEA4842046.1 enoyl-CoA hydratase-related protein [[Clostridium] symbiosum]MEA5056238.1 enoyl-CoA hydratase-related protein [Anaerotignum propionicum]
MKLVELKESIKNIIIEIEGEVAILTMNRPKALNALNAETMQEVIKIMECIGLDDSINGVIITAEGKGFIAGADITQFVPLDALGGRDCSELGQMCCSSIERLEKPVIAAVNGYALGGGNEVAMACDIRIASTNAVFGQPEVNLGIMPCFGGTQRLTRLVAYGVAKELIFTARQVKADEALSIGLVNKVVAPEELLSSAKEMMSTILTKAPKAISMCKVAINRGKEMDMVNALELERDVTGLLFSTADKVEGVAAFLEKRPAKFIGK